jgi:hypothetical protein
METLLGSPQSVLVGPATPTFKQTLLNGHGLLTPKTPDFCDLVTRSPAIVNDGEDNSSDTRVNSQSPVNSLDAASKDREVAGTRGSTLDVELQAQMRTQFDIRQERIRDAEVAASLAQVDARGKRRSTRLAKREAEKGKLIKFNMSQSLTGTL